MRDPFRPLNEPARSIYDAFIDEAAKRGGRSIEEWRAGELKAVWRAARDYAQQQNRRTPRIEAIEREERSAAGHIDYGAQWAYGVARLLEAPNAE